MATKKFCDRCGLSDTKDWYELRIGRSASHLAEKYDLCDLCRFLVKDLMKGAPTENGPKSVR